MTWIWDIIKTAFNCYTSSRQGLPRSRTQGWGGLYKYLSIFRSYFPVHWILAIPAGMTWTWGVLIKKDDERSLSSFFSYYAL